MIAPKAKTLLLLTGETVKVDTVHYAAGKRHWRVSWIDEKSGRPKGCVAELVGDRFEEAEDDWRQAPAGSAASAGPQDPTTHKEQRR